MDSGITQHFDGLRTEIRAVAQETEGLRNEVRAVAQETKELRSEIRSVADRGEEIKRSLGAVSESLRTDIRTVAEGLIGTNERLDRFESRVFEEFGELTAMVRLSFAELDRRLASRSLPSAHEPADPDDIPVEVPARVALVQVRVGDVHEPVPDDDRPRIGRRNGNRDPGPRLDEEVEARARRRRRPRRVEGTDAELDVRPDRPLGRRRIPPAVAFDGDRVGVLVAPVPVVVDGLADPQPRVDVETDLHAARNEPAEVDRRRRELRPAVPPPPEVASAEAQDRGRATPERARILRAHRGGRKEDHEEERGARGGSHAREW